MPEVLKYPADISKFNKWLRFDVRAGRHVGRGQIVLEKDVPDVVVIAAAMYVPSSALRSQMTVNYDTTEFSGMLMEAAAQGIAEMYSAKLGQNAEGFFTGGLEAGRAIVGTIFGDGMLDRAGEWLKGGSLTTLPTQFQALAGQVANPRTDIIFTAQDYRTWTFEYILIPRTLQEAKNIERIVNMFRFYMLPSYRGTTTAAGARGSYMMGYPYEWTIGLYGAASSGTNDEAGNELSHINKIGRSVLKNLTVDQAAAGKVAFVGASGEKSLYPLVTSLTLEFQEVILLGRDQKTIVDGNRFLDPRNA